MLIQAQCCYGENEQHPVLESAGYQGSILDQEHSNNGQESPLASLHPPEAKSPSPHHVLGLQKSHRERPDKLHHCVVRSLDRILPQYLSLHSEGSSKDHRKTHLPSLDICSTFLTRKVLRIASDTTHPSLPAGQD